MTEIECYKFLKEDIETVLEYIGTNIILNFARQDDTYSLNDKERIAYVRLSKCVGRGYEGFDLNKESNMTENKRFDVVLNEFDEIEYITDIVDCEDRDFADFLDFTNKMAKENEQLKLKNKGLKSELTILKTDIQHSTMIINELHDKNKQTKEELDYIQNSISEHIKHQKTELGIKALQEIIADYNEWLLGHKEVKE